jgi:hypothetical protein
MNYFPVSTFSPLTLQPENGIDMKNLFGAFFVSFSAHALVLVPSMLKLGML